jgi:dolichol-phosphate mannosyltransferase
MTVRESTSLIVPLFNESELIEEFASTVLNTDEVRRFYEVVLVDDGSRDSSWQKLLEVRDRFENVRLVRHNKNRGLGAALRSGVVHSRSESVCWIPIDGSFAISDVIALADANERAEVILYRRLLRSEVSRNMVSWAAHASFRAIFGCDVRHQSGLFLMPRHVYLENMAMSNRAISNLEFIVRLNRCGCDIATVDIPCFPRSGGSTKTFSLRTILRSVRELAGLLLLDPSLVRRRSANSVSRP